MNIERLEQIISSYGTQPDRWPREERGEALELLAASDEAKAVLEKHQSLDHALSSYAIEIESSRTIRRLLARIEREQNRVERVLRWLLPERNEPASLWRPALAASLPLIFGLVLGSVVEIGNGETYNVDEELYLMGLANQVDDSAIPESLP